MKKQVFFIVLLSMWGCADTYKITVEEGGAKILTGLCTSQVLSSDLDFSEWYTLHYAEYQVDTASIHEVDSLSENISFLIFLGTWCGDSKREVPHFLKIIEETGIALNNIRMYGLDRSKKSDDGITEQYNVSRVPTFIVLKGKEELGRIVEFPQETLEKDLVGILKRH